MRGRQVHGGGAPQQRIETRRRHLEQQQHTRLAHEQRGPRLTAREYLALLEQKRSEQRAHGFDPVVQSLKKRVSKVKDALARTTLEAEKLGRFSPLGEKAEAIALAMLRVFDDAERALSSIQSSTQSSIQSSTQSAIHDRSAYQTIIDAGEAATKQAVEFMRIASATEPTPTSEAGVKKTGTPRGAKNAWKPDAMRKMLARELAKAEEEQIAVGDLLERLQNWAELGELAATVAHDIRTPLTAIVGYAELAQVDVTSVKKRANAHARIAEQIEVGREIARGLLDVARGRSLEPQAVQLAPIIARAMRLIAGSLAQERIEVKVELFQDERGPSVSADACDLTRIIIQLAKNAKEALASTSGVKRLTVRARIESGDRVRIELADNGPGIDPLVRDRLFQEFVTTKSTTGGTGLGLFGVRRIVERHGGMISVDSEAGRGATFIVSLPIMHTA